MSVYKEIVLYQSRFGRIPFKRWLLKLKDLKGVAKIQTRINRLKLGDYGDYKHIKNGVYELRIHYGSGYRVYFSEYKKNSIVVLLLGGTKGSQESDIVKAMSYWDDFREKYND